MVLLNGNKYACETCIKGHRSSTCRHTDRPLFEIKKKGRPITQCEHCRELRKTKQVHVKCVCEGKEELLPKEPPGIKKGHTLIPGSAAFPQGLPEALGASVAFPAQSKSESASDSGGSNQKQCACKSGDTCICWWPRKHAPRRKSKKSDASPSSPSSPTGSPEHDTSPQSDAPAASHILARLAELRPVLPRPAARSSTDLAHDPSSGVAHGLVRHHGHEASFSPYGRAYDFSREPVFMGEPGGNPILLPQDAFSISQPNQPFYPPSDVSTISSEEQMLREQLRALEEVAASSNAPNDQNQTTSQETLDLTTFPSFPSTCNCGDGCLCPGCFQHNAKNAASIPLSSAFSSCMNPGQCTSCLDCTILSLPASLPPDTSVSIYDAYGAESIDDWIRQMSQLPSSSSTEPQTKGSPMSSGSSPVSEDGLLKQTPRLTSTVPEAPKSCCSSHPADADWEGFLRDSRGLPMAQSGTYVVRPCCGVLCKCEPDECQCELDKEGGYDCRQEMLFPSDRNATGNPFEGSSTDMLVDPYHGSMHSYPTNDNPFSRASSEADASEHLVPPSIRTRSSSASSASHPSMGAHNESSFDFQDHVMGSFHDRGHMMDSSSSIHYRGQVSTSTPNHPGIGDTTMTTMGSNMMDLHPNVVSSLSAHGSSLSVPSSGSVYPPSSSRSVSPPSVSSTNMSMVMTGFGNVNPGDLGSASAVRYAMSMSDSDTDGYTSDHLAGETGLW